jgi:hypothetical protein
MLDSLKSKLSGGEGRSDSAEIAFEPGVQARQTVVRLISKSSSSRVTGTS